MPAIHADTAATEPFLSRYGKFDLRDKQGEY